MSEAAAPEVLAFVGIGANLGDALGTVLGTVNDLAALPQSRLLQCSSLYRTAPIDASGPDFVNAVVALRTRIAATALLAALRSLEHARGRKRPYSRAPRTLDLDLLLYGEQCIVTEDLMVPHPRMYERAFVLVPLAEIAPERVTPEQLAAVADQPVERMEIPKL